MTLLPPTLPLRVWLAGANVPPPLLDRDPSGPVAILLEAGRIAAIEPHPVGDAPVLDLHGATVLSAFVDPHTHLDKGDLLAAGLVVERNLFRAIDAVQADYARWSETELRARMGFALRTAYAHGTRALLSYIDWSQPAGPPAWRVLLELRREWQGRIELLPASLATIDLFADPRQAEALGRAVAAASSSIRRRTSPRCSRRCSTPPGVSTSRWTSTSMSTWRRPSPTCR
jgi:cytosine deaminase